MLHKPRRRALPRAQLCRVLRLAGITELLLPVILMSSHTGKDLVEQAHSFPLPASARRIPRLLRLL